MTMRPLRLLTVLLALMALALPATGLSAGVAKSERGVVQSVDAGQIVLRALDGRVDTFTISPTTPVRLNGARASIAEVRPGFVARVAYDRKNHAVLIEAFGAVGPPATTDRGVVIALTRTTVTVRTTAGATVTFAVDAATRFKFHGAPARRQVVKVGAQIAVTHAADAPATVVNVLKRAGA